MRRTLANIVPQILPGIILVCACTGLAFAQQLGSTVSGQAKDDNDQVTITDSLATTEKTIRPWKVDRFELFAGYQYLRASAEPVRNPSGWKTALAIRYRSWLSFRVELSGNYGSQSPVDLHRHSFFLGPQFNVYSKGRARLFLVALFGAIHDSSRFRFRTGNVRAAASSSVLEYGGGFDVRLTRYVSYRIEVFPNFFPEEWQNDGRVTTGLVFHFGARKHH